MRLTLEDKQRIIEDFSKRLDSAQVVIIAEYRGIQANDITKFRRSAREKGVYLSVMRNTLVFRAFQGTSFAGLEEHLSGPLIYGVASDFLVASKLFFEFSESNEFFVLRAASMDGRLLTPSEIKMFAELPSRDQLLAKLLGTMQAPVAQFVRTLHEVPARFVRTLAAYRDSKN